MQTEHLRCLLALARENELGAAARARGLAPDALLKAVYAVEREFGRPVLRPGPGFAGFTPEGERVLGWARLFVEEYEGLHRDVGAMRAQAAVEPLLARRSVSPKRLRGPGPGAHDIGVMLQAALRAPDHGGLHPWRVIEFAVGQRAALADAFEAEKRRRDPLAPADDLRRAREHATRPPVLLAFVVSPQARSKVPVREQWLSAGAALGNLLNAAQRLGFGAIVLSGERCFDAELAAQLGVRPEEFLAGFVSLGSVAEAPPAAKSRSPVEVWSAWMPRAATVPAPHTESRDQDAHHDDHRR
jgi:nitroreductase